MTRLASLSEAQDIHQAHLDALSGALLSGDFEAFIEGIHLPHVMLNDDAEKRIETRAQSRQLFIAYHRTLVAQGVTEYARLSTGAVFQSTDIICAAHETHILRKGQRIVEPYANRILLERIKGGWYETTASNAIVDDKDRMLLPKPSANPVPRDFLPASRTDEHTTRTSASPDHAQD